MQVFITLIFWVLLGSITAYYAKERGRHQWGWFCIGLFLGIFGIILLFVLPRKKLQTPPVYPEMEEIPAPPPKVLGSTKFWYYLDGENKQLGPMSYNALVSASQEGKVTPTTYVWNEDLENWKRFGELVTS